MAEGKELRVVEHEELRVLIQQSHVPECTDGLNRPLTESDFEPYKQICESNLISINSRLKERITKVNNAQQFIKEHEMTVVHLLILCGEHSILESWSSSSTVEIAADIVTCVLLLSNKRSVSDLLTANGGCIFRNALLTLRPKLLASTWKCNPAAVSCYCWLLMKVKEPHLNDYLRDVLPTALIITDDFEDLNKIKGLQCINHIVNNVTKTDLEIFGYIDVIVAGLRPILFHNELDTLEAMLNCYVTLVRKMDMPYCNHQNLKRSKLDDIFDVILSNLDLESKDKCKIVYLKCIPQMIYLFRLRTLRHSRKLLELVARELHSENSDYIKGLLLEVLDATVKCCWPRLDKEKHYYQVILAILKVIHDLSIAKDTSDTPNCSELLARIKTSMQLMKHLNKSYLEQIQNDIKNSDSLDDKMKAMVDFVIA